MSNETTSPVAKWILIGVCVVSLCVVGALFLIGTYPAEEYRAAAELEKRGFEIGYDWKGCNIWQYPYYAVGRGRSITEDDIRLICQLRHLLSLDFRRCDLSELNLDDIGNCLVLSYFCCDDVTPFPADEIRKLTVCPINGFWFTNTRLDDSDMADLAKWTTVGRLDLDNNVGITDTSFEYFEKIVSLRFLNLKGTSVTKEGVEEFKKKRPDVEVRF